MKSEIEKILRSVITRETHKGAHYRVVIQTSARLTRLLHQRECEMLDECEMAIQERIARMRTSETRETTTIDAVKMYEGMMYGINEAKYVIEQLKKKKN